MTGRCRIAVWTALGCLLATSGCMTRKGFVIGADLKLEFNRIPWRTGPDGKYEVDGPDCLTCGGPGAGAAPPGAGPGVAGGGCPPAALPGDCGLPPAQPHPRSRFNPLPMHDVLNGGAPMPPPCMLAPNGQIIQQEVLPEIVPQPPAKPIDKVPPVPPAPGNPTKTEAPFQLEEKDESPSAKSAPRSTWISNRSRSATAP